jgi:CelD/BcsL family acetyltransferase involved in cellulose biosynthesis
MIRSHSWEEWPKLCGIWEALHGSTPGATFFTSVPWVSTWLEVYGPQLGAEIQVLEHNGEPRAAWILVRRTQTWHSIPLRRVYFGTAGEDEADGLLVEYNGFVCDPRFEKETYAAVRESIDRSSWDEMILPGVTPEFAKAMLEETTGESNVVPTSGVDLAAIRGQGEYLNHLSKNTRQQVRKSYRFYERRGALAVEVASGTDAALAMLDELAELHQKTWKERGERGAFASERFNTFHRTLIRRYPGSIQLLRVRAGEDTIGALYSMMHGGVLHTYQSGFRYEDEGENNARPGLVVTALAIEHAIANTELGYFDLMAGAGRYKESLSTVRKELGWYTVSSNSGRAMIRNLGRWAGERLRSGDK